MTRMIARAPAWLRSALAWRWTPAVVLLAGSLIYVLGAILLVPSEISFSETGATANGSLPASNASNADTGAEDAEAGALPGDAERKVRRTRRARQRPLLEESENPDQPTVTPPE